MKINIVSNDKRYVILNEMLKREGYDSKICTPNSCDTCDALIFSVRNELSDNELSNIFDKITVRTLVLCGNGSRVRKFFDGRIIEYSNEENFVSENARLTAEGTVSYLHTVTQAALKDKRIFVCGYGRIGKELCRILKALGSEVYSYARRKEMIYQMSREGIAYLPIEQSKICDIIINTVPSNVFSNAFLSLLPKDMCLVELASYPYGFENMDRVHLASGIPGKILPYSAAKAIFDTIFPIISLAKGNE